ncbi:MAG: DUF6596 domain-containing protein [Planctomycetota bacterium]
MAGSGPRQLVDHYFRHESARLIAALTRRFGMRHLPLAEDDVQVALSRALASWPKRGNPDDPTRWLLTVAINHVVDQLRRESRKDALTTEHLADLETRSLDQETDQLDDSLLRLIFVCCDPCVPAESQLALALKTLCGFSVREVARALVSTTDSIEKRISRAKARFRHQGLELEGLSNEAMRLRLSQVQHVLYLLFNEGYSSTQAERIIRVELCEEAVRLALILAEAEGTRGGASSAFLALLLFHAVRLDARLDEGGAILLFEEQDLRKWDLKLLREAYRWFEAATSEPEVTRYHAEALIAAEHCRGKLNGTTDWSRIVDGYALLCRLAPSPIHQLNQAIAIAHLHGPQRGLQHLESIDSRRLDEHYYLWHAIRADLLSLNGQKEEAEPAYRRAWDLAPTQAEKELVIRKLDALEAE